MKEDQESLNTDSKDENINEKETNQQEQQTEQSATAELEQKLNDEKDKYVRLYAEFDNFRKRTGKERLNLIKSANESLMQALLPVMDDFDRAIPEISKTSDEETVKGISLIQSKFSDILRNKGLKKLEVKKGDAFDAETQEAITQIEAPSEDLKGKVVEVIESGFSLNDKIIRYPKVVVGK